MARFIFLYSVLAIIIGILIFFKGADSPLIGILINFISAVGVVGALFWSIHVTQQNHQFEEPELFISCNSWSSQQKNINLFDVANVGKLPALRVKIYMSSDKTFSDKDKFYCDYADMILPGQGAGVTISTHSFIAYELKRPYKKPIDINRCISYDSGDDFYKSYIRFEYSSMYNREIRKKDFTVFFQAPIEGTENEKKYNTYMVVNSVEGLV